MYVYMYAPEVEFWYIILEEHWRPNSAAANQPTSQPENSSHLAISQPAATTSHQQQPVSRLPASQQQHPAEQANFWSQQIHRQQKTLNFNL